MNKMIELLRAVASGKTGMLIGPGFPNTTIKLNSSGFLHIRDGRPGNKSALLSVMPDIIVIYGPLTSDITELLRDKQKAIENPLFYKVDDDALH